MFQSQINDMQKKISLFNPEKKTLKELDIFVLDNSLRETTVGQLRGHTLENKSKILEQVFFQFHLISRNVCVRACMGACVRARVRTCARVSVCVRACAHACTYACTYARVRVCMHAGLYVCVCMCRCACVGV